MSLLRHAPLRALRRSPGLSALMITTLAFGLAVWFSSYAIARAISDDPMREVTGLYRVELARHSEIREILSGTDMVFVSELPLVLLSPSEVEKLSRSGIPSRTAAVTSAPLPFEAPGEGVRLGPARFASPDALELFGIRLASGRIFGEGGHELLVSERNARRWFGGAGSAPGRVLRIAGEEWRITGVVAEGAGAGRRMHLADDATDPDLWLPFAEVTRLGALPTRRHPAPGGEFYCASVWIELRDADAVTRFRGWLRRQGVSGSPRIRRYAEWSGFLGNAPPFRVLEVFGEATLAACCLALVRLFTTRSRLHRRDLAVRRALGASRRALLIEALAEGLVIVGAGVTAGMLLAAGVLHALDATLPGQAVSLAVHATRAALGMAVGLGVGLGAALLPAWRACAEQPARGLGAAV